VLHFGKSGIEKGICLQLRRIIVLALLLDNELTSGVVEKNKVILEIWRNHASEADLGF
jgi:hypothetical protein